MLLYSLASLCKYASWMVLRKAGSFLMRCTSVSCSCALLQTLWYTSGERSEVEGAGWRAEEEEEAEAAAPEAEEDLLGWSAGGLLLAECWKALGERSTASPGLAPDSPGPAPDTAKAWFTEAPAIGLMRLDA